MLEEVSAGLEIVGAWNIHGKSGAEWREEMFLHHSDGLSPGNDFVLRTKAEEFLVDPNKLGAAAILDRELVAKAEDLAVDVIHLLTVSILDAEVVAPGQNSLPHHVAHDGDYPLSACASVLPCSPASLFGFEIASILT